LTSVKSMLVSPGRIRYYVSLIPRGITILLNDGWRIFWFKLRRKINTFSSYELWIKNNDPAFDVLQGQIIKARSFEFRPKISIIMPVWNTDLIYLKRAIVSVINQTYDNWELCIADGNSSNLKIKQTILEYANMDTRIKAKYLENNKGISGNSNEALSLATGEHIGLLDHDDELTCDALYEVVKVLNKDSTLDFIYTDEDKIDLHEKRFDPSFKPDWSPDLLLSRMYTCHFSVYRKALIDSIGGFRSKYDGSQDYDLVLRVTERTDKIYHIPQILYHWRMTSESAATNPQNKTYAYKAGRTALLDYINRNKIKGQVYETSMQGLYRVQREIVGNPLVSIILPTKDKTKLLKRCVDSILKNTTYSNYELLIIDNQSEKIEELLEYCKLIGSRSNVKVTKYAKHFNFAALNNFAVSQCIGEHVVFLNNDTEVISQEWLTAMLEHSQRKEVGAVGAKLLYPDGSIQHSGVILGYRDFSGHVCQRIPDQNGYLGRTGIINNYTAVTAACMMVRKALFCELGGFNEDLAIDFNDIDLCLRMREKGYLVVFTPYARLYHRESFTRGYTITPPRYTQYTKELELAKAKWGTLIEKGDPYYNPNLSLTRLDFSIDPRPRRNR
jgi:O-antigen biosynthesis protein